MSFNPIQLNEVSRVEIIGPGGREFVAYVDPGIVLYWQDDGRTLKIFVGDRREP